MAKQTSTQYISALLDKPGAISDADQSSIASFRQSFPYFVPVRYMDALANHRKNAFSPAMLSAVKPYMGDWMMFCNFLDAGTSDLHQPEQTGNLPEQAAEAHEVNAEEKEPLSPVMNETIMNVAAAEDISQLPEIHDDVPADIVIGETILEQVAFSLDRVPEPVIALQPAAQPQQEPENVIDDTNIPGTENTEEEETADPFAQLIGNTAHTEPPQQEVEAAAIVTEPVQEQPAGDNQHWIQDADEAVAATPLPEPLAVIADIKPSGQEEILEISLNAAPEEADNLANEDEIISMQSVEDDSAREDALAAKEEKPLIYPVYTEDYFLQQGLKISRELPDEIEEFKPVVVNDDGKALWL